MTETTDEPEKLKPFTLHVMEPAGADRTAPGGGAPGEALNLQSGGVFGLFYRDKEISSDKLLTSWHNTQKALSVMIDSAREEEEKGIRLEELGSASRSRSRATSPSSAPRPRPASCSSSSAARAVCAAISSS